MHLFHFVCLHISVAFCVLQDIFTYHNEHPFSSSINHHGCSVTTLLFMYCFVHVAYLTYTVLQLPVFIWVFPPCRIYFCVGFSPGLCRVSTDLNQLFHVIVVCTPPALFGSQVLVFVMVSFNFCVMLNCLSTYVVHLPLYCACQQCLMTACVHERMCNFACVCETIILFMCSLAIHIVDSKIRSQYFTPNWLTVLATLTCLHTGVSRIMSKQAMYQMHGDCMLCMTVVCRSTKKKKSNKLFFVQYMNAGQGFI